MKISIKCDCGNEVKTLAPLGKYTQFRDYLSSQKFYIGNVKIEDSNLKEFTIQCNVCKSWIVLGVD